MKLTAAQRDALDRLRAFVAEHGADNLSTKLIHGGPVGNRVNNGINCAFRGHPTRPRESKLALACRLAEIAYEPGMIRGTTLDDDIEALYARYQDGHDVTPRGMGSDPLTGRMLRRMVKRVAMGGKRDASWQSVVHLLAEKHPDVNVLRFFDRLPSGGTLPTSASAAAVSPRTERSARARLRAGVEVLRALHLSGQRLSYLDLAQNPETKRLLYRLNNDCHRLGRSLGELIAEATGKPYIHSVHACVGAYVWSPYMHARTADGAHRPLRSAAEALGDDLLALAIGVDFYEAEHRHEVPYRDACSDESIGGKYKADIAVCGALVEVTSGLQDGQLDPAYAGRLDKKRAWAASSGVAWHTIEITDRPEQQVDAVLHVARALTSRQLAPERLLLDAARGYSFQRSVRAAIRG